MSQTKNTGAKDSKQPTYEELMVKVQNLEAKNAEKDIEIEGLNEHISEQEAEKQIQFPIATASDGTKYQLRFRTILMRKNGDNLRVTPKMVKEDVTLLDELIRLKTPRILPLTLDNQEKGGKV